MTTLDQLRAENSKLRGQLDAARSNITYWRERAIFLEGERDFYRDQQREVA